MHKIISVQGFGHSGAGAIIDLLREFENVDVFGKVYKDSVSINGTSDSPNNHIFNLFSYFNFPYIRTTYINNNSNAFDYGIKFLIKRAWTMANTHSFTGKNKEAYIKYKKLIFNYVTKLIKLTKQDKQLLDVNPDFFFPIRVNKTYPTEYLCYNHDKGYDLFLLSGKLEDFSFVRGDYIFYEKNPELDFNKFCILTKNFFEDIISVMSDSEIVVLHQFLKGYSLDSIIQIIPSSICQIVVYRDPRDMYYELLCEPYFYNLLNKVSFCNRLLQLDLKNVYHSNDRCLLIKYENLIFHYDEVVDKICKFLDISKSKHVNQKKYFDPDVSKGNIGKYRKYHNQSIMNDIANILSNWLD